uniref:HERV-H LTR-associating protein 2 n=1 Tax=Esox lucius TaxID=8010 RepID=C1BZK8_ESOLU|nr:HERV-H LTR-associating protein 2 precursor [Esox lucius]
MRCWCFVYVILLMELQVFSQEIVQGFLGENVILPCTYVEKLPDYTVFWRYKDEKTVYDINAGKPYLNKQDPQFINRTSFFPNEWQNGNFSLILTYLKASDSGVYSCALPAVDIIHSVELSVQVRPTSQTKADPKSNSSVSIGGNTVRLFLFLFIISSFLK